MVGEGGVCESRECSEGGIVSAEWGEQGVFREGSE